MLFPCLSLREADTGERWDREHDARNAAVVRGPRVPLQEVRGDDRPLVSGDRRQRQAAGSGGGVARRVDARVGDTRSEEHTSELQSQSNLVCRLLLEKKKKNKRLSYT